MDSSYRLVLDSITEPLQEFIRNSLANSTGTAVGSFVRVNASLHQPVPVGSDSHVVEQIVLVSLDLSSLNVVKFLHTALR